MKKEDIERLIEELSGDSGETEEALLDLLRERYGEENIPLVLRVLQRRPDVLASQTMRVLARARALEPKVSELVAIAAAAALRCEFCIKAHVDQAAVRGATEDEIFEAILIAGQIAESSTQAVAFRVFRQATDGRRARSRHNH